MSRETRSWRWKCPHCDRGVMSLRSAARHLRNTHFDCWSCKAERLMVLAMLEGKGFLFEGPLFDFERRRIR